MERYARYTATDTGPEPPVDTHVAVVGAGALGTHILETLARHGFTNLTVVDRDIVREENLSTAALYTPRHVGMPKPEAAAQELARINPETSVTVHATDLHGNQLEPVENAAVILDATDNMQTRHLLNEYSHATSTPVIFTGCTGTAFFTFPVTGDGACFTCIYPDPDTGVLPTCATAGLLRETAMTAAGRATHTLLTFLTGNGFTQQLYTADLTSDQFTVLDVETNPDCRVCSREQYQYLGTTPAARTICGADTYQFHPQEYSFNAVQEQYRGTDQAQVTDYAVLIEDGGSRVTCFADGRILVTGVDAMEEARSTAAAYISL